MLISDGTSTAYQPVRKVTELDGKTHKVMTKHQSQQTIEVVPSKNQSQQTISDQRDTKSQQTLEAVNQSNEGLETKVASVKNNFANLIPIVETIVSRLNKLESQKSLSLVRKMKPDPDLALRLAKLEQEVENITLQSHSQIPTIWQTD